MINKDLISGKSTRIIANRYKLSQTAVLRHKVGHLPDYLSRARVTEQVTKTDDLISDLHYLRQIFVDFFEQAKTAQNIRTAAPLMSSAVKVIETPVEVRGELNTAGGDQHHHVTSMGRNMAVS